jgi:hypothetical protein
LRPPFRLTSTALAHCACTALSAEITSTVASLHHNLKRRRASAERTQLNASTA